MSFFTDELMKCTEGFEAENASATPCIFPWVKTIA